MPKIERSVAYTFDAYSGGLKGETSDLGICLVCFVKLLEIIVLSFHYR